MHSCKYDKTLDPREEEHFQHPVHDKARLSLCTSYNFRKHVLMDMRGISLQQDRSCSWIRRPGQWGTGRRQDRRHRAERVERAWRSAGRANAKKSILLRSLETENEKRKHRSEIARVVFSSMAHRASKQVAKTSTFLCLGKRKVQEARPLRSRAGHRCTN